MDDRICVGGVPQIAAKGYIYACQGSRTVTPNTMFKLSNSNSELTWVLMGFATLDQLT